MVAVAVAWSVAAGAGCVPNRGTFEPAGYVSPYGYQIAYERGTHQLLPAEWTLDNFQEPPTGAGDLERKTSDRYVTKYELEDDTRFGTAFELPTYAVRYEHRVHAGAIWLRDIPIKPKLRHKDLRVLMQSYIDEIAGATYETVQRGGASPWESKPRIVVEQRLAAEILEEGPATVAGQPAYAATISVANIDEVHVAQRARTSRIQLVLLRAPQDEVFEPGRGDGPTHRYPVVLLAGYSNMPADFAKGLDDFHRLLRKLTIGGTTGLILQLAPAAAAPHGDPAPAAPTTTPPAAPAPPAQP